MLTSLEGELKKILLAGVGAVALTAEKAESVVRELVQKGELTIEQGKALNEELKHKMKEAVQEYKSPAPQHTDLEHMTREEREALRRKLEELDAKDTDGSEAAD